MAKIERKKRETKKDKKVQAMPSISFLWNNTRTNIPQVIENNISMKNINDIFIMTAENILLENPEYYSLLLGELQYIYDSMYNNKNTIN